MCRRMINLERPCNTLSLDVIVEHFNLEQKNVDSIYCMRACTT